MLANFAVVVPTRQTALYTRWQHICPVPDLHKHHPNLNLELLFSHLLCWAREKKSFRLHEKSFFFLLGCGKSDFQHCTTLTMERKRRRRKKNVYEKLWQRQPLAGSLIKFAEFMFFRPANFRPAHPSCFAAVVRNTTCASNFSGNCPVMWF